MTCRVRALQVNLMPHCPHFQLAGPQPPRVAPNLRTHLLIMLPVRLPLYLPVQMGPLESAAGVPPLAVLL